MSNSVNRDETSPLDLCCLKKPILSPVAVKELTHYLLEFKYIVVLPDQWVMVKSIQVDFNSTVQFTSIFTLTIVLIQVQTG